MVGEREQKRRAIGDCPALQGVFACGSWRLRMLAEFVDKHAG